MSVAPHSIVHVGQREGREILRGKHGRHAGWREARIQKRERGSGVGAVLVRKMADRGAVEQRLRRLHDRMLQLQRLENPFVDEGIPALSEEPLSQITASTTLSNH